MAEIAIAGATAVLRQAAVVLGNLVDKEGSRVLRLAKDLEWIENEMRHIETYLEEVEDKQWGNRGLTNLVRNIWGIAYDVEDIIKTYLPKLGSYGREERKGPLGWMKSAEFMLSNSKIARDFAVEIEGIKTRVAEIDRLRKTYDIEGRSDQANKGDTWDPRQSFPHFDEAADIVGLDEDIKNLVDKVLGKGSQHPVVSIIGMPGLGKTTLAKKVYNSVQGKFECSAWIYVSQQPNIAELLRDIAEQVGLEKKKREQNLVINLFAFLREKRYVIVLDDLWQIEPWDDGLKKGIPNNFGNGSRIILTSRNRAVGVHVGGQNSLHVLQPLDPENSKNLFFKKIGGPQTSDPLQLKNIREEILKKCGGVPLAIVITAGLLLLKERTEPAWTGVLKSMGQEDDKCSKIFALSYKDLPAKLKPCFLYFGLFPEDYEIPAFDLINIWVAEGFIRRGSGVQEVEEMGDDYLNNLVARNLIQVARRSFDGRIKSCRIHDMLHNLCLDVAKDINFFNSYSDLVTGKSAMGLRRVIAYSRNLLEFRNPKLRAMLCFDKEEERELKRKHVKNFLRDSRFLQVLRLEFEFFRISLPGEIGNLSHLSYIRLKVRRGRIELPSAVRNLRSLQTLDARECDSLIIPDCIWKMEELRHLLLPLYYEVNCNSRGRLLLLNMGKLFFRTTEAASRNLQTLYTLCLGSWSAKYEFPKFTNLRKLGVSFEESEWSKVKMFLDANTVPHKLEILRLARRNVYPNMRYHMEELNLCRYKNLCRLHLKRVFMVKLPEHDKLPPNLTKLILVLTQLKEDPMETLKKLTKLKILKLGYGSYIGENMTVCSSGEGGPDDNFPQLQVLDIKGLYSLRELIIADDDNVMPRLNKLRITHCDDLECSIPERMIDKIITI